VSFEGVMGESEKARERVFVLVKYTGWGWRGDRE